MLPINQPLPLLSASPGPELPKAPDFSFPQESECRPPKVAAEEIPAPRGGEAWGLTLYPSQLSGPKSVQEGGMPEPRSHQLGSRLAFGCLPGNMPFHFSYSPEMSSNVIPLKPGFIPSLKTPL